MDMDMGMTTYPVLPIIMPSDLAGTKNGQLPASVLRNIQAPNGQLHRLAATAWNAMQLAAYFDGIELKHVGAYRPLSEQMALFSNRYALSPTGRKPQVTRTYQGATWYLKKGMAPASTPARSNHGWALAIDVASVTSGKRLDWLLGDGFMTSNALRFGFTWEVKSGANAEAWHIRFVCGDKLPQAVLDAIAVFPTLDVR
jgi:LAS superfamily LD-carboxypeptidase LdcB